MLSDVNHHYLYLYLRAISESKYVEQNAEFLTNSIIRAAELSIPQGKNRKRNRSKPLPYWNDSCKKAVQDRNKARNAMHKNKTLENCMNYRRLKGKAQHAIKYTAREYWQNCCNTLDKSTKLGTAWKMTHKMNGFHREHKIWNLKVNGVAVETNEEKSDIFAKRFSDISSDKNHSSTFLLWKKDIESYYKYLFENLSEIADKNRTESLNEPFDLHEVHRALREIKKTFCSWCRQNIV